MSDENLKLYEVDDLNGSTVLVVAVDAKEARKTALAHGPHFTTSSPASLVDLTKPGVVGINRY